MFRFPVSLSALNARRDRKLGFHGGERQRWKDPTGRVSPTGPNFSIHRETRRLLKIV